MEHSTLTMRPMDHHRMMIADLKKRFFISLVLSLPVIFFSPMIQKLLGISVSFPGSNYILLALSTLVFLFGGKPFLVGAYKELMHSKPAMMTLIGLAITVSYFYSAAVVFGLPGEMFFAELVTLIDIMLLGHWIEMRSVLGASMAVEKLTTLLPATAHRILPDGTSKEVLLKDLKKGDHVLIKPGEKISADGMVISGESEVNEAALTGESTLVFKTVKSKVIAGSINQNGSITVQVEKDMRNTYIAQVIAMVHTVLESKSHAQDIADKAALFLTIIALSVGVLTFIIWFFAVGDISKALEHMVSVMVISCPHALGLAIPLVMAVVTTLAAQEGLLIRDRRSFEQARAITTVVFDKTGTLTYGLFEVTDIISLGSMSEQELLQIAAGIERFSEHSISKALVNKAQEKNISPATIENFKALAGKGNFGLWLGKEVYIGNVRLMKEAGFDYETHVPVLNNLNNQGKTAIFIAVDGKIQGILALSDTIRKESLQACRALQAMGIKIVMITGDNALNANAVAKKLGIEKILAEILPADKAREIQKLQNMGEKVAMVGDGINDAPALAAATLGVAIGAGTDIAIESADIVLVQNDPRKVTYAIDLSRTTRKKMVQNLLWATGYNVIAIPLAAGVFHTYGLTITPAVGAFLMSISTIIVAINSQLIFLRK